MATEETTISELELADELLADMNIAVDTATETRAITLKQLKAWLGSSLPTGFIVASVGKINDERFTLLDGKTLSRVGTYEAFCNKVVAEVQAGRWTSCTEDQFNQEVSQTGQCNKFVITNDYVRIPKFGNSMYSAVIGGKIPVVGNGKSLGLTTNGSNIYGLMGGTSNNDSVMTCSNNGTLPISGNASNIGYTNNVLGITKDASKSGIEGTLSTNPMTIYYYMVVSTERQTASVEIDINKVYEDLNLKANNDLSNVASVASSFKEASVGWGMPDYSAGVTISTSQTESNYTPPANGVIIGVKTESWNDQEWFIKFGAVFLAHRFPGYYGNGFSCCVPVQKGKTYSIKGVNVASFTFYPFMEG